MSDATYTLLTIFMMGLATLAVRLLPFWLLGRLRDHPLLAWLGEKLPPMAMPILVVFCLKDVVWTQPPYGIPELASMALIVAIHLWKEQVLVSLAVGMSAYFMLNSLLT